MRTLFVVLTMLVSQAFAQPVPTDYIIGPEDVLEISVWREPDLQRDNILVRPDGNISFPLAGDIPAAGMTISQVKDEIANRIKQYIPDPVVNASVVAVGGNKIYIIGQVMRPGSFVIGRYVDVLQALTLAGGFNEFAKLNNIKIVRRAGDKDTVYGFRYPEVQKGRNLQQNIILRGGDTIIVP